jgi:hypothetical protein
LVSTTTPEEKTLEILIVLDIDSKPWEMRTEISEMVKEIKINQRRKRKKRYVVRFFVPQIVQSVKTKKEILKERYANVHQKVGVGIIGICTYFWSL